MILEAFEFIFIKIICAQKKQINDHASMEGREAIEPPRQWASLPGGS